MTRRSRPLTSFAVRLARGLQAVLLLSASLLTIRGQESDTYTFSGVDRLLPDGDPSGIGDVRAITTPIGPISSVQVGLTISSSFSGDLYVYLSHNGRLAVLLNRPGRTDTNPHGYGDYGFDVTFDDSAANDIHDYESIVMPVPGSPLTGTWQPDARFADPSLVTDSSPRSAFLSDFIGLDANGTWTLFLADMDPGGTNFLDGWSLEITGMPKSVPTVTWASPAPITYGTALGSTELAATASVPGTFIYSPPAGTVLDAALGQVLTVAFIPTDTTNFINVTNSVQLDVLPQPLVVTASDENRTYGIANPTLTGTMQGLQNGDPVTANYSTTADASTSVGAYTIVTSLNDPGGRLANYIVTLVNGTLTINPAPLVVSADNQTRSYGAPNPPLTWSVTGFVDGDTAASVLTGSPILNTAATAASPVGAYPITLTLNTLNAQNYALNLTGGTLTVSPVPLVVTTASASRTYGAPNPSPLGGGLSGLQNGDRITVNFSCAADTNSPVGSYPILASLSGDSATLANYAVSISFAALAVLPAPLTGTVNNCSRFYGQTNPLFNVTYSGFVNGQDASLVTGSLSTSTTAETNSPPGAYPVLASGQSAPNYSIQYVDGNLSVIAAPLLVQANNASRAEGQPNPAFSASFSGFANGENVSALGGSLIFTTTATTNSPVGQYPIVPSGLAATNYTLIYSNGVLSVKGYQLVINVDNQTRPYGSTNPPFTGTLLGVQPGDNITATYSTTAGTGSPVGSYPITASLSDPGGRLANYSVVTNFGSLVITPAPLLASADNQTRLYGDANPNLTGSLSGLQNGDNIAATFSTSANGASACGNYLIAIQFSDPGGRLANYNVTTVNGTLTVDPAPLVAGADNQRRSYGATNPPFTGILVGLRNNDNFPANYTTSATITSPVGAYPITVSLADPANRLTNYTVSLNPGTLTITPASLVVTAYNQSRGYGATNPPLNGSLIGVATGDGITATFSTSAGTNSPPGAYPIVASLRDPNGRLPNYSVKTNAGTLLVTAAVLTITADNQSKTYGATNPPLTWHVRGFLNGDTQASSLTGVPFLTTTATPASPVGGYPITPELGTLSATNYLLAFAPGTLTVTPAGLLAMANAVNRLYGQPNPQFTASYGGFVNGENPSVLTGTLSSSTSAGTNSPVGVYPVVIWGQSALNYSLRYLQGTMTIEPAPLVVQADDATRLLGQTNPVFTATFIGFMNDEGTSVLSGNLSFSTTANIYSPLGNYPIVPSGLSSTNYSLSFLDGTLVVGDHVLIVTADNQTRSYGATNPPLTGRLTGVQAGDNIGVNFTSAANTNSPLGAYPITAVFTGSATDLAQYSVIQNKGTLTVTPALLTVSADSQTRAYGSPNPSLTGSLIGLQNGDDITASYSTAADTNAPVGVYPIAISISDPESQLSNYVVATNNGTLSIVPASLTVSADSLSRAFGAPNPSLTGSIIGLQNGDDITANYSTSADVNSPPGLYLINVTLVDPNNLLGNYSVTINPGTLAIQSSTMGTLVSSVNPASFGSLITFTLTLSGIPSGNAIPTGSVQFLVDGVAYGPPAPLLAGTATLTTNTLPVGSHSISAQYAGDANFLGVSTVLASNQVVFSSSIAPDYTIWRAPNLGTRVAFADLLTKSSYPQGDTILFVGATSPSAAGGTVNFANGWLFYEPPPGFTSADSFTYTVQDQYVSSAMGTINIQVDTQVAPVIKLVAAGNGTNRLLGSGIPWTVYTIQMTGQLMDPAWRTLSPLVADSQGNIEYDYNPRPGPSSCFYRLLCQPQDANPGGLNLFLTSSANPVLPGSPVTLTANAVPADPGSGFPSGTVQFELNGSPLGSPVPLVNGFASLTTTNLPTGQSVVTVEYGGDGNFLAASAALDPAQIVNSPPVAITPMMIQTMPSGGTKVSISDVLTNDYDPDGNTLSLVSVSALSAEGGKVAVSEGWVFYSPPTGFSGADSFTYTFEDSFGATAEGTVTLEPLLSAGPLQAATSVSLSNGTYQIQFVGIPWRTYTIEYALDPEGTNWITLGNATADAFGTLLYDDTPPANSPPRFYQALTAFQGPTASPFRVAVWTNFVAYTNGRVMDIWAERTLPPGWPDTPPVLAWNTNGLLYGLDGFTAISQCNEFEGSIGQIPATLLTPRHAYLRGHGMGPTGFSTALAGQRVWFCTSSNTVVQMEVAAEFIENGTVGGQFYDYGLLVFKQDVPAGIAPMPVISSSDFGTYYSDTPDLPYMYFGTEQNGFCSAQVPPFVYDLLEPGDSGSPDMIPTMGLDNRLIMFGGRTTSGASAHMQADMDVLTTYVGLSTNNYQLRWYDMTRWAP